MAVFSSSSCSGDREGSCVSSSCIRTLIPSRGPHLLISSHWELGFQHLGLVSKHSVQRTQKPRTAWAQIPSRRARRHADVCPHTRDAEGAHTPKNWETLPLRGAHCSVPGQKARCSRWTSGSAVTPGGPLYQQEQTQGRTLAIKEKN